jgi:hypothetical protein
MNYLRDGGKHRSEDKKNKKKPPVLVVLCIEIIILQRNRTIKSLSGL